MALDSQQATQAAMDEIQEEEEQLNELFAEVDRVLKAVQELTGRDRNDQLDYCRTRTDRINRVLANYRAATRYLSYEEKKPYDAKVKEYEARYKEQLGALQFAEKSEVTGGGVGAMTTDQMLGRANDLQQQDIEMLHGMIRTTETDKEIGVETLAQLDRQNEQLRAAKGQVERINSDLDVAKKTLRQMANRYATDKLILIFIVLIVLAIIVAIIVACLKKKDDGSG